MESKQPTQSTSEKPDKYKEDFLGNRKPLSGYFFKYLKILVAA